MIANKLAQPFSTKYKVVFLRHGQSIWNKQNRFTGWTDVRLSANGIQQAIKAGKVLHQNDYRFDYCFTSTLTRAIQTFNYAADQLDSHYIPIIKSWRLNERHYGALQGLNKQQTLQKHGKQKVLQWRRSYDIPPPTLQYDDKRNPAHDTRYATIDAKDLPLTQTTIDRVMPFWQSDIIPKIKQGRNVLIVAHGNSLRAIVKKLINISDEQITKLNIPTAIPLVYEFDQQFKVLKHFYLADPEQLQAHINKVKNQTKG